MQPLRRHAPRAASGNGRASTTNMSLVPAFALVAAAVATAACRSASSRWPRRASAWRVANRCAAAAASATRARSSGAGVARRATVLVGDAAAAAPSAALRPKQSLGQNFLVDANIVAKIVAAVRECAAPSGDGDGDGGGAVYQPCVVEVGPGTGALTLPLLDAFPSMTALEIDQRAVQHLRALRPRADIRHCDVRDVDWLREHFGGEDAAAAAQRAPLTIVGNLPYNIVSQVLFSCFAAATATTCRGGGGGRVRHALFMMQYEVAQRIVSPPRCKHYGILSVMAQLCCTPRILFRVPPTVFRPRPDVTSAMVRFDFRSSDELERVYAALGGTDRDAVRRVVRSAFQQRRKTLRNALARRDLPERWASRRAEELTPQEFVELTRFLQL